MRKTLRHLRHLHHLYRLVRWRLGQSALLAGVWRRLMLRTTVIAVTGSVGKTTCRRLLAAVLGEHASTYQTPNNENDLFGVPRVLLGIRPWHRYAVIELGASGPGTLGILARMVRPDIAIVTAVANTHTNRYAAGIEEIAHEKAELVRHMRRRGTAVLNGDDPRVCAMRTISRRPAILFGSAQHNDVRATQVTARWPNRLSLTVTSPGGQRCRVQTQLVGTHWRNSVLAAIAVAAHCGVDVAAASTSIRRVEPFRERMQPLALPNGATVIRDQNASLDVFQAMLAVARDARCSRRIVVLGDLIDTGKRRSRHRLRLAGQLAASHFDVAIFIGPESHRAARAAIAAGMGEDAAFYVTEIREAAAVLHQQTRPGDLVFVKGRNKQHLCRAVFLQFGEIGCRREDCQIRKDCDICPHLQPSVAVVEALRASC